MNIGGNALSLAETQFGLRLLSQLVRRSPGENVVVSPIGLFQALSLYAFLAGEPARQEMRTALQIATQNDDVLRGMYQRLAKSLSIRGAALELDQATAFWAGDAITLDAAFQSLAAEWEVAVFAGADVTIERMRAWASEKTRGHLAPSMGTPLPHGVNLMNAVYFRGEWQSKFDTTNTCNRPFYRIGGLPKTLSLMRQPKAKGISLYHNADFDAVRIPYASSGLGHELSLHVFLPRRGAADALTGRDYLTPFVDRFTLNDWDRCQSGYNGDALVDLILPPFTFRQTHDLKRTLEQMGLRRAFDVTAAQTTPFVPALDKVLQQVYVAIDEEGTTVAALTEITLMTEGGYITPPSSRVEKFYADRPFLFFLSDDASSLLLFAGVIHDPAPSGGAR